MSLFAELKRRNVFRVALAYLIAAWLILQVSQLVLETIEAPAWVLKVFLLLFALGLPISLMFSWAYELTPDGLKREEDVDRSSSVTQGTGKKLDQITIAMVIALVVFVAVDRTYYATTARHPLPRPAPMRRLQKSLSPCWRLRTFRLLATRNTSRTAWQRNC